MAGDDRSRKKVTAPAASRRRSKSPAGSVEVSSPSPVPSKVGHYCLDRAHFQEVKEAVQVKGPTTRRAWRRGSSSSGSDDAEDNIGSSSPSSSPIPSASSSSVVPQGTEDSLWGGIDRESQHRCCHGQHPRRMFVWQGRHTGRRFLGCPFKGKGDKCRFLKWMDDEWPARAQQVICTLWDMVDQFIEKAEVAQVDAMATSALRNEVSEEKEELERQIHASQLEKTALLQRIGEHERRSRFARTICGGLHARILKEGQEKKMMWVVILALAGLLVATMFGVILKRK